MKNIRVFLSENFQFLEVKFSTYLNRHVFVMQRVNMVLHADESEQKYRPESDAAFSNFNTNQQVVKCSCSHFRISMVRSKGVLIFMVHIKYCI